MSGVLSQRAVRCNVARLVVPDCGRDVHRELKTKNEVSKVLTEQETDRG
jgi:hypothetical protein